MDGHAAEADLRADAQLPVAVGLRRAARLRVLGQQRVAVRDHADRRQRVDGAQRQPHVVAGPGPRVAGPEPAAGRRADEDDGADRGDDGADDEHGVPAPVELRGERDGVRVLARGDGGRQAQRDAVGDQGAR